MESGSKRAKIVTLLLATRPNHLVASAAPIVVGSCLGYATVGSFSVLPFVLALFSIMLLQAGATVCRVHEIIALSPLDDQGLPFEPTGVVSKATGTAFGLDRWFEIG